MDLPALQMRLRQFADERDWKRFHTPKNLAMALIVEAAELVEVFQWMTPQESDALDRDPAALEHAGEEMADVLLYLVHLADRTGVDLEAAVERKLAKNAIKYPPPG